MTVTVQLFCINGTKCSTQATLGEKAYFTQVTTPRQGTVISRKTKRAVMQRFPPLVRNYLNIKLVRNRVYTYNRIPTQIDRLQKGTFPNALIETSTIKNSDSTNTTIRSTLQTFPLCNINLDRVTPTTKLTTKLQATSHKLPVDHGVH